MSPPSGALPTAEQALLLRACLLEGAAAADAFRAWRAVADLDHLDNGSFRLLPLLFRSLSALGIDDPQMGNFRGTVRLNWYRNRILFHKAAGTIAALESAGIPVMLLKGTPLALLHYDQPGLRPMEDVDLAVPPDSLSDAVRILREKGWRQERPFPEPPTPAFLHLVNGVGFRNGEGHGLDLHWHLFAPSLRPHIERECRDAAVPMTFEGIGVVRPCATDLLLHIVAHGAAWNPMPPLRWVADTVTLLRAEGNAVDWKRLARHASEARLSAEVRRAFFWLREELAVELPSTAWEALESMPLDRSGERLLGLLSKPLGKMGGWGNNFARWLWFVANGESPGLAARLAGLASLARYDLMLPPEESLRRAVLLRGARRIYRTALGRPPAGGATPPATL